MLFVHGSPSCYSSLHQCHPPAPCSPSGPSRTRSIRMPACLRNLLHRPGRLRLGGRGGTDRRRYLAEGQRGGATTRPAAATVPPAPRCLPNATRRGGGLFAHAEACGFGHRSRHRTPISGSIKVRVLTRAKGRSECCGAGCCLASPAPTGPGGGPHRAQEPGRLGRPQQPAGPLLPLQCRPAMEGARRAVGSARWRPAAGCCWRTHWELCIVDADPVTPGRSLVISRRHGADGLALHQPEWNALVELPQPIVHKRTSTC